MPKHIVPAEKRAFARQLRKAQTSLEAALWRELRGRRLDGWKFRRQVPIEGYVADFVCFDRRLIIEVDGPLHAEPEQRMKDAKRDAILNGQRFRILRMNGELAPGSMIDQIRRALAEPPHPTPD